MQSAHGGIGPRLINLLIATLPKTKRNQTWAGSTVRILRKLRSSCPGSALVEAVRGRYWCYRFRQSRHLLELSCGSARGSTRPQSGGWQVALTVFVRVDGRVGFQESMSRCQARYRREVRPMARVKPGIRGQRDRATFAGCDRASSKVPAGLDRNAPSGEIQWCLAHGSRAACQQYGNGHGQR